MPLCDGQDSRRSRTVRSDGDVQLFFFQYSLGIIYSDPNISLTICFPEINSAEILIVVM